MAMTYEEAREMIRRTGTRNGRRKLENNTYLIGVPEGGAQRYAIRLHDTDVITLHPDCSYTLNSGGWRTVTTKDRINRYAPVSVASDRGAWYVYPRRGDWDTRYPFADGMRLIPNGNGWKVEGAGLDETAIRRDLSRQIRTYVDGFAAWAVKNGLPDPGPGDCWGCALTVAKPDTTGKAPWGQDKVTKPGADMPFGVDHIFEHFREKYYVPSLLWRAEQRRGDPAFCYRMIQAEVKRGDTRMLKGDLRAYFKTLMPALVSAKVEGVSHVA